MRRSKVSLTQLDQWACDVASHIEAMNPDLAEVILCPIPRGGLVPAFNLLAVLRARGVRSRIGVESEAHYFVDDIIDSGATRMRYLTRYPNAVFLAVVNKLDDDHAFPTLPIFGDRWVVFPWEDAGDTAETVEDNVRRLLQYIGEDPNREGLQDTPARVVKAYQEWFSGYREDPNAVVKVFADGAEGVDEMVVVKDIQFYSHCEHHMAPFFGTVTIAYIPDNKIIGLSKLPRLVEIFSRRLQVQERLGIQLADFIEGALSPKGVAVLIKARHLCVESRGVRKTNAETITSALRGSLKTSPDARAEFLRLAE